LKSYPVMKNSPFISMHQASSHKRPYVSTDYNFLVKIHQN